MATTVRVKVRDKATAEKIVKKFGKPALGPFGDALASAGEQVMLFDRTCKDNARRMADKIRGKPGVLSAIIE
jgi:hypothetical protein